MAREQHYKKEGNDLHVSAIVSETKPDVSDWTDPTGLFWIRKSDKSLWVYMVDDFYPVVSFG